MELIQNAEDNTYDPTVQPFIRFSIKPDTLIVYNNEIGFAPEDVESICSVGQTTKSKKKNVGYIGEKGIGFKSVFKISDSPKVISNGLQFEFRRSDGSNLGYIVPYWLSAIPEYADRQVTNIILPLRDDARERLNLFDEIDPTLILFLRKLQRIEIIDNVSGNSKTVTKSGSEGLVTIDYQDQSQYWRVIRATFRVPQEIVEQEPRREDVKNTEIILAFPVSETGLPISIRKAPKPDIFAFLPVKKCDFSFIIQADFLLTSDREDILQDSQWNQWLRSNILDVLLKAIEEFKRDEKLKTTFFKFLSLPEEINDEFFSPLMYQIFQSLSNVECILTESGSWKKPCDVYYAEDDLKDLVSNDELRSNFGKEYVTDTFYLKKELRDLLGIANFTPMHLVECLKCPEWVKKHSNEWVIKLYRYCAEQLEKAKSSELTLDDIRQLPIIKLENGDYCSANSGQIFLYLERAGKKYGFESDLEGTLRVLDADIRNAVRAEEDEKDLIEFLKKLNVVNPDPSNIINQHILPQYHRETWRKKPSETLEGHIHFIKDHFEKLQKDEGLVEVIRKTIYLRINSEQDQSDYRHPDQIYLSDDYGSEYHLSSTMAAVGETFFLENSLHPCYVRSDLKDIDVEIRRIQAESKPKKGRRAKKRSQTQKQVKDLKRSENEIVASWKAFVTALGVHEGVSVSLDPETEYFEGSEKANNWVTRKKIYRGDLHNTPWEFCGWRETEIWYFLEDDYISRDLERIFDCFNRATQQQKGQISSMLFNLLVNTWDDYRDYLKCRYYYRGWNQRGWSSDETQTTFLFNLRTFPWAITTDRVFAPLKGLFLDSGDIRRILGSSVLFIGVDADPNQHAKFIRDVGIRTDVNVNEVIEVIGNKVDSGSENVEEFKYLYSLLRGLLPKDLYSGSITARYRKPERNPALHAFREEPLIFIPETDQKYFTADNVFWDCKFDILQDHLPSLKPWYAECRGLFLDDLVVKESPGPEDLVAILEQIAAKAEISEADERKIVTIYKEFNEVLKQNTGNSYAPWWKSFTDQFLLWVNKKQFWRNDGNVFVNDDPALYKLFVEREDIAFLEVGITDLRDLEYFVKYAKIPKLSESVECVLAENPNQVLEELGFAQRIQDLVPYILRYLYYKHQDDYDRLKEIHKLDAVRDLRCVRLDTLAVEYILRDQAVNASRDVLLGGNTLYISTSNQSKIAVEFAKLFGDIEDLDIFMCSLFTYPNSESIETFLESVKIPRLPADEDEWLTSLAMTDKVQEIPELIAPTGNFREEELGISSSAASTAKKCLLQEESPSNSDSMEQTTALPSPISRSTSVTGNDGSVTDRTTYQPQSGLPRASPHPELPPKSQKAKETPFEQENEDSDTLLAKNPESVQLIYVTFSPRQRMDKFNDQNRSKLPEKPASEEQNPELEHSKKDKRLKIGHWGEKVVYYNLKREMQERYPGASLSETENGFTFSLNGSITTETVWYNKVREGNDRGHGHDIKVVENGEATYIEVKSSIQPREAFMISKNEWDLAKESGDRYFIYHVYYSPSEGIIICEKIQNPVKLWQLDELEARIIQIQL